jgi:ABC-type transport system substrate-binding protein
VNQANADFPFVKPNFDRAVYLPVADEAAAVAALESGEVDAILAADGLTSKAALDRLGQNPSLALHANRTPGAGFIVINPEGKATADPAFRRALFCAAQSLPAQVLNASPAGSFVAAGNGNWPAPEAAPGCSRGEDRTLLVEILKAGGYSWLQEPTAQVAGTELRLPDGVPFPPLTLLVPAEEFEARPEAIRSIEGSLRGLGMPFTLELAAAEDVRFAVFSSKSYDLAILSWRLSLYPGYLCDWFGPGGLFDYGSGGLSSACKALEGESDLAAARARMLEIQSILMEDLPFIPLYAAARVDAYHDIRYPFETLLGGTGGWYGAPSLAIPAP